MSKAVDLSPSGQVFNPNCLLPTMNPFQPRLKIKKFTHKHRSLYLITDDLKRTSRHHKTESQTAHNYNVSVLQEEPSSAPVRELVIEKPKPMPESPLQESLLKKPIPIREDLREDPYYTENMSRAQTLQEILFWDGDISYGNIVHLRNFPLKEPPGPKSLARACTCEESHASRLGFERLLYSGVPSVKNMLGKIPSLKQVKLQVRRQVQHPEKILVFNIEGLLIDREHGEWVIRPKLGRTLQKLQFFFQLVFVYESGYPGVLPFLRLLKQEEIKPSGLYEVPRSPYNLADYSCIFDDFNVIIPSADILILSAVDLPNEEVEFLEGEELVGCPQGSSVRILAKRACVVSYEYTNSPATLLVPRLAGNPFAISAFSFARVILAYKLDQFANIIFSSQLVASSTDIVSVKMLDVVAQVSAKNARNIQESFCCERKDLQFHGAVEVHLEHCPLHSTCTMLKQTEMQNLFVTMRLSNFMNGNGPQVLTFN